MPTKKASKDNSDKNGYGLLGDDDIQDSGLFGENNTIDENFGSISTEQITSEYEQFYEQQLKLKIKESWENEQTPFKYLQVALVHLKGNEYVVHINNQDHGLLNYLVSKLLKIKGVEFAAYKSTNLENPTIYIHTDGSKSIKNILKEAIKQMKIEFTGLKNAISKADI